MTAINEARHKPASLSLTVRGRRLLAGLLLAPVAFAAGVGLAQLPAAVAGEGSSTQGQYEQFATHTVLAGETMWQIAERIAGNGDVRDVVAEIMRLNALSSVSLQPGQQIALPNL